MICRRFCPIAASRAPAARGAARGCAESADIRALPPPAAPSTKDARVSQSRVRLSETPRRACSACHAAFMQPRDVAAEARPDAPRLVVDIPPRRETFAFCRKRGVPSLTYPRRAAHAPKRRSHHAMLNAARYGMIGTRCSRRELRQREQRGARQRHAMAMPSGCATEGSAQMAKPDAA